MWTVSAGDNLIVLLIKSYHAYGEVQLSPKKPDDEQLIDSVNVACFVLQCAARMPNHSACFVTRDYQKA